MHALVQAVETLIVALAAAAFAHFGVAMKDASAQPPQPSVVRRIPVAATSVTTVAMTADKPCERRGVHPV